jgi:hypothetical protein
MSAPERDDFMDNKGGWKDLIIWAVREGQFCTSRDLTSYPGALFSP